MAVVSMFFCPAWCGLLVRTEEGLDLCPTRRHDGGDGTRAGSITRAGGQVGISRILTPIPDTVRITQLCTVADTITISVEGSQFRSPHDLASEVEGREKVRLHLLAKVIPGAATCRVHMTRNTADDCAIGNLIDAAGTGLNGLEATEAEEDGDDSRP